MGDTKEAGEEAGEAEAEAREEVRATSESPPCPSPTNSRT